MIIIQGVVISVLRPTRDRHYYYISFSVVSSACTIYSSKDIIKFRESKKLVFLVEIHQHLSDFDDFWTTRMRLRWVVNPSKSDSFWSISKQTIGITTGIHWESITWGESTQVSDGMNLEHIIGIAIRIYGIGNLGDGRFGIWGDEFEGKPSE